jgi:hypothetical protein
MQKIKLILLLIVTVQLSIAHAKSKSGEVNIVDSGGKVVDAAKLMLNGLPVLISPEESSARSQNTEDKIRQDLKNGKITEKEANKRLRENCMGMINNPQDKIESFLGILPITGFLKDLDLLCHQYK